jgi:predicted MFS family arabinose efflux permease
MKSKFEKIRANSAFVMITILVLLAAFICSFSDYIGENPFAGQYALNNPVQLATSEKGMVYVTDSSTTIVHADSKNRLDYVIYGGNFENTFDTTDSVAMCGDDLYVIEDSYSYDGSYSDVQRVLRFTNKGKTRQILYTVDDTLDEDGTQVIYLDSPIVLDGEIYFSEITAEGISVKNASGEVCGFMPLEDACMYVSDSTFDENFQITAVLMNGDVVTYAGGELVTIYDASDYDTTEYNSLITGISCDGSTLYLNDVGLRRIYALENGELHTFIERNEFSGVRTDAFAESAIYSGLESCDGTVSVISELYDYDSDSRGSNYTYSVAVKNQSGDVVFYGDTIGISASYRALVLMIYAAILLAVLIGVYAGVHIVRLVKGAKLENSYTQLLVLLTAIAVTIGVSYTIFDKCNQRYMVISTDNLANIAYLTDSSIDKDILASLNSPDDFYSEEYEVLCDEMEGILKSSINNGTNIYAVIYKVYNDVLCEVYRDDLEHAVMYPMPGTFTSSIEQTIANSGECYTSDDYQLAEGSYTFALIPSYDEDGTLVGLIEVGTDCNYLAKENAALYKKILIISSMAVIIIMLLFGELMNAVEAVKARRKAATEKKPFPPEVIRPISFMVYFTANITTAFLPIYSMSLWNEHFPLVAEVAAALPLSAELLIAGIVSLLGGFLIKKPRSKNLCAAGAVLFMAGNALSAFAPNLWVLILANSICGVGEGVFIVSINSFIVSFEDEETQNKGFIHFNVAVLAGMNCGTVIGSIICDNAGVFSAYMTAVVSAAVTIFLSLYLLENKSVAVQEEEASHCSFRNFVTWDIVKYFLFIAVPYFMCGAFLSYYFPLVAEEHALSAVEISMAFLISGVISIYAGSVIGELIIAHFGTRKSLLLASFIYAAALFYLYINPSILSCYAVIVLFAVADSFGFSAQSSYFISRPEVIRLGQSRALGIHSTVENAASACGSVVFGTALLLGEKSGILLIAVCFTALLVLFAIGGKGCEDHVKPEDGGHPTAEKALV